MKPNTRHPHFWERCRERGIHTTSPETIRLGIVWAVANDRDDIVERALKTDKNTFWRFRCPEGIFYAVWPHGALTPVTVMTQEMLRKKKFAWKHVKRGGKRP